MKCLWVQDGRLNGMNCTLKAFSIHSYVCVRACPRMRRTQIEMETYKVRTQTNGLVDLIYPLPPTSLSHSSPPLYLPLSLSSSPLSLSCVSCTSFLCSGWPFTHWLSSISSLKKIYSLKWVKIYVLAMFPLERAHTIVSTVVTFIYENRDPTERIGVQSVGAGVNPSGVRHPETRALNPPAVHPPFPSPSFLISVQSFPQLGHVMQILRQH